MSRQRPIRKISALQYLHHAAVSYKPPTTLTYNWNFGVLALFCLVLQIVTGIFLAMHYISASEIAFVSVEHIMRDVNFGWLIRYIHANGASMFFFVVYIHVFRGLYYGSYLYPREWLWATGVVILLVMILTAFMGYVLPWGQMSFWAATVITNLASAIPFVGVPIVQWLWGGYAVGAPTLTRFYSLHYLMPFILVLLVAAHIFILHSVRSNNPIGINAPDHIQFTPYYTAKDSFGFVIFLLFFSIFLYYYPNVLGHTDNYIKANPMVTPTHIVPEWYFLPFYAILRSVPDKLGGVVLLLASILVLLILPIYATSRIRSTAFRYWYKLYFWFFFADCLILGWIGGKNIEPPYYVIGQLATFFYFFYLIVVIPVTIYLEKLLWTNRYTTVEFDNFQLHWPRPKSAYLPKRNLASNKTLKF